MANRERSAEGGTRLSVVHIRVGEEDTALGRESPAYMTSLANKTVVELCPVED